MIEAERYRLAALGHMIEVAPEAVEFVVRQGYHRTLGVRPMRGAVERFLQNAIAQDVLNGGSGSGWVAVDVQHTRYGLLPAGE